jgi:hypothetical protein
MSFPTVRKLTVSFTLVDRLWRAFRCLPIAFLLPFFAHSIAAGHARVNPLDVLVNQGSQVFQKRFFQIAEIVRNVFWQDRVRDVADVANSVAKLVYYVFASRLCRFFHDVLLIKRQTADYSDGEAILTLLKYDRTALFVP